VIPRLFNKVSIKPESLTGDAGDSAGALRKYLEAQNITSYIPPISKLRDPYSHEPGFHVVHLICIEGIG
jgi:hypothetical protein